jgi:excisionase family DNA binding protein
VRKYLTLDQAATSLGVHYQTVRDWILSGRLRASKPGGHRWRIRPEDLERLLSETVHDSSPAPAPKRPVGRPRTCSRVAITPPEGWRIPIPPMPTRNKRSRGP